MWRPFTLAAVLAFLTDQISKWLVVHVGDLKTVGTIEVFPPFLTFRMGWNKGINFGLFQQGDAGRWILIGVSLAICAAALAWLRHETERPLAMASGGLLIGGALGNVLDRLLYGAVADFLNMSCCGIHNPYAFNVADVAIFAGAVGLIIFAGEPKKDR